MRILSLQWLPVKQWLVVGAFDLLDSPGLSDRAAGSKRGSSAYWPTDKNTGTHKPAGREKDVFTRAPARTPGR